MFEEIRILGWLWISQSLEGEPFMIPCTLSKIFLFHSEKWDCKEVSFGEWKIWYTFCHRDTRFLRSFVRSHIGSKKINLLIRNSVGISLYKQQTMIRCMTWYMSNLMILEEMQPWFVCENTIKSCFKFCHIRADCNQSLPFEIGLIEFLFEKSSSTNLKYVKFHWSHYE